MKILISDFSYVLLFPRDKGYSGKLNELNQKLASEDNYQPLEHFELNSELLKYIESVKQKYPTYLFTEGFMHRLPELKQILDLSFNQALCSEDVGYSKSQSEAYTKLAELLKVSLTDIVFIDDKDQNISAAREAGVTAIKYQNNEQIIDELGKIFI